MKDLQEKYTQLNNSFKRKLVFHLGSEAGFFSEYNNMILAMLYCLEHKIQFILYSDDANFGYEKGWTDYFLPFCKEVHGSFHKKYNIRNHGGNPILSSRKERLKISCYKLFSGIDYFTQDLWLNFRDRKQEDSYYTIPELGINGNLQHACSMLINLTWRYNPKVEEDINKLKNTVQLPTEYIGLHIRQGDKIIEAEPVDYSVYMNKAKTLSDNRDTYISTDDYTVIENIKKQYPGWNVYTHSNTSERGYIHAEFQRKSKSEIKNAYLELFVSMDMLYASTFFIGTYNSNVGMYMGMRKDAGKCFGVDMENWRIW
ncbi:O-fucosyltransferase family protein [Viscerimonas tarda]